LAGVAPGRKAQRTRCGSMKADPAAIGPEATREGASVLSD
jgi:hypothetical protein